MDKNVTRSVITSTIKLAKIKVVDGKVETQEEPAVVVEDVKLTIDAARKHISKTKGADFVVLGVEHEEAVYSLPLADFLKAAKKLPARAPRKPATDGAKVEK